MADLTTAQRAPIVVTQADGTPVTSYTGSVDDETVATIQPAGPVNYLVGVAPGEANLNLSSGGQSGTLHFSVSQAPLVITLGTPEPK